MSNHQNHERTTETTNYASRLLSRMLDDRKRPHERASAEKAKVAVKHGHDKKEEHHAHAK